VAVADTVRGFRMILDGELDEYPESAFYMKGSIDQVIAEGKSGS
jgi:F-type H+-transporting ATPase subunit beta